MIMKIHTGTDITVQPGEMDEDKCTAEEKQRLLDAPPRISSAEDEPWWVTTLGVLAFGAFIYILLVYF